MSSARKEILNRLKKAVHQEPERPDFEAPIYFPIEKPLDVAFKENLEKVSGSVHLFDSEKELFADLKKMLSQFSSENVICNETELQGQLSKNKVPFTSAPDLPPSIEAGITSCEFLIAHTGSVMVSAAMGGGRQLSVYPPIHVVVAKKEQLVDFLGTAYTSIQEKYGKLPSQITLVTGPSRTADIEKTLVMGAHGPRELHVFIA